jgi:8-oxo-dGTP pyrophosphatase MutT (NUDIX family)
MDQVTISRRLGGDLSTEDALAYGVAAIRETFEEAGVLLAYRTPQSRGDVELVCNSRRRVALPKGWLHEWVALEGWTLILSKLWRWTHWITPEARSRRYDTRFFVALMPAGQDCIPDTIETTDGIWVDPEEGLDKNLRGELPLSPPTLVTLNELMQYSNLEPLEKELENRQWGETRKPQLIRSNGAVLIILPWDPMYEHEEEIGCDATQKVSLSPGEPFSRLWYQDGIWTPVEI